MKRFLVFILFTCILCISFFSVRKNQGNLTITEPNSGLRLTVINKDFPLLKILLPGQSNSERGIEVEFPEHVTGINEQTNIL
jgi:hypothetical protein